MERHPAVFDMNPASRVAMMQLPTRLQPEFAELEEAFLVLAMDVMCNPRRATANMAGIKNADAAVRGKFGTMVDIDAAHGPVMKMVRYLDDPASVGKAPTMPPREQIAELCQIYNIHPPPSAWATL